ncbi:uncharacterized protein BDW70DRAFT_53044 [Aspergillus foveolatus]|uniref:uncharacterized protein n=1 Tax=Aspergillus foveolatus TaxID=210207 RepID=UPI003CCDFE22
MKCQLFLPQLVIGSCQRHYLAFQTSPVRKMLKTSSIRSHSVVFLAVMISRWRGRLNEMMLSQPNPLVARNSESRLSAVWNAIVRLVNGLKEPSRLTSKRSLFSRAVSAPRHKNTPRIQGSVLPSLSRPNGYRGGICAGCITSKLVRPTVTFMFNIGNPRERPIPSLWMATCLIWRQEW